MDLLPLFLQFSCTYSGWIFSSQHPYKSRFWVVTWSTGTSRYKVYLCCVMPNLWATKAEKSTGGCWYISFIAEVSTFNLIAESCVCIFQKNIPCLHGESEGRVRKRKKDHVRREIVENKNVSHSNELSGYGYTLQICYPSCHGHSCVAPDFDSLSFPLTLQSPSFLLSLKISSFPAFPVNALCDLCWIPPIPDSSLFFKALIIAFCILRPVNFGRN